MEIELAPGERRFLNAALSRKRAFLVLSLAGVAIGGSLAVWYALGRWRDPGYALGLRSALVVLILLNARQNLRQYRYASLLERFAGSQDAPD